MLSPNPLPHVWVLTSLSREATKGFEAAELTSMRNKEPRLKKGKMAPDTLYRKIICPHLSENSLELVRSLKIRLAGSSDNCSGKNPEKIKRSFFNSNPYLCSNTQNKYKNQTTIMSKVVFLSFGQAPFICSAGTSTLTLCTSQAFWMLPDMALQVVHKGLGTVKIYL